MKSFISTFITLFTFGLLVSCGNNPAKTTFEITTSAITTANNTYQGGFVIMGKSASGQFTIPVNYNSSGTSNSVTLEVPKDKWTFWAVSWDGAGGIPKQFQGTTRCGVTTADLTSDSESVKITLDTTACTSRSDIFGDATHYSGNQFLPLRTVTCGWLYTNSSFGEINSSTPTTFCNSAASFDELYKVYSKTVKVEVMQNILGVESVGMSMCFTSTNGVLDTRNPSLPSKGLPVRITLYDGMNCLESGKLVTYNFPNGLSVPVSGQDSAFNVAGSTMNVFLPMNELKKGYTAFADSIPRILCGSSECMGLPTSVPGGGVIIKSGTEFQIAVPESGFTCSHITNVSPSGSFSPSAPTLASIRSNCRVNDEGSVVTSINFTTLTSASITIEFTKDGFSQNNTFSLYSDVSHSVFEVGWAVFGYPLTVTLDSGIKSSFKVFHEDERNHARGVLSKIVSMFSPDGPGGVIGRLTCSTGTKDATISFNEDGETKTYRAVLVAAPTDGTADVSSDMADGTYTAGTDLTKRLIVQRLSDDNITFDTEVVIDFICGQQIGRLASYEEKEGQEERTMLEWNTRTLASQKVFSKHIEEETDGSGVVRSNTSRIKVQKVNSTEAKAEVFKLEIERQPDSTYTYQSYKGILLSSSDRVFLQSKNYQQTGYAVVNNATFDDSGAFSSAFSSPVDACVKLSGATFQEQIALGEATCTSSSLLSTLSSAYTGAGNTFDTLLKANISSSFTNVQSISAD